MTGPSKRQSFTESEWVAHAINIPGDNPDLLWSDKTGKIIKTPQEVRDAVTGYLPPRWQVETLGRGTHKGQGWALREHTPAGDK
jgi:hypothetical protein